MKKCALVLGGTGLVGKYLLARLISEGYLVHLVSRKTSGQYDTMPDVRLINADLSDPDWIKKSDLQIGQYHVIFHLAYATHGDARYNHSVTVDSLRFLLDERSGISRSTPCHVVFVGSMVVFGSSPIESIVTENSLRAADSTYGANKLEATRLAMLPPSGTISTVLHPTGVYDGSSRRIRWYRQLLEKNYVPRADKLGLNNIIHADDVAAALIQCLKRPMNRSAEEYIINGETIRFDDWFARLETTVKKQMRFKLPTFVQYVCRGPVRRILNFFYIECPVYFSSARDNPLMQTSSYSSDKAAKDFDFMPMITFKDVCDRILLETYGCS